MVDGVKIELDMFGLVTRMSFLVSALLYWTIGDNKKNIGALWGASPLHFRHDMGSLWGRKRVSLKMLAASLLFSAKSCSFLSSIATQLQEYHSIHSHVQYLLPRRISHKSLALCLKSTSFQVWLGHKFILFRSRCLAHDFTSYYYNTVSSVPRYSLVEMSSTVA